MATEEPHSFRTQAVASPWTLSKFSQTQARSVTLQSVLSPMDLSRQGMAHSGMSARVWAWAMAARATAAKAYFILTDFGGV